ncbi:SDR family NAD(P)-dependent oxidoreductase [Frigoribacterium sp. RIT-PI-h]|uniref:SDR family NAD(P)-dependent oxidoreductase n=1 Tax=Frigoribacterium sp. RIT-PI-h TaxID=1690245 RepID=UPI0006B976CA|nr:SDR family oxidoreductase [Frigoribacterium sp. RIT-PI-h]KPG81408.1 hypothetical protein AEQ27_11070 [Frigoribacterium sp. RIT-PI-h]
MNTTSTTGCLAGRRALVTGASRGIGAAIARALAADGASVVITYWSSADAADELVRGIRNAGGHADAIRADAGDAADAVRSVQRAVEILGGLDIVVPNAATAWNEAFADASAEHIEKTLDLNLRGPAYTVQEALRHISDGGRIILISSLSAQISPFPGQTADGMSKAALTALGRYGTPDEVGNLVAWLASEQSSYITGSVINIDEGVTA